ncbi:helix-turn-helix domain-containing protein [Nocardia asteroides]|uniref:helix-turn-helix domain-containing protein n=1 Tax=Nocardia asteroides TaxID=1824 RepID=UPI0033D9F9AD
MPGKDKHSPESIDRRAKMVTALQLRRGGAGYRAIADHLGVSISTAYSYVADALKEVTREPAESVLQIELDRLDDMMRAFYPKALRGDYKAADRVLRIMERRGRLTGLDALAADRAKGDSRDLSDVDKFLAAMLGDKAEEDES